MAKDGDDKGFDEHTRIGGAPPKLPGAPAPAAPATPPAAPPPLDESTRVASAPPPPPVGPRPAPPAPAAPPPLDESTRLGVAPPPMPKGPVAPPAAPASVAPPPSAPATVKAPAQPPPASDFAEHTVLLSSLQEQAVPPARMQRMAPPGRSDVVNLDRTHFLMGRLPSCDFRLYSQTASREHAQLTARDGRWYLTPVAGKVVLVNGSPAKEEVPLTHKMRLQLGGDELIFLDESGATEVRGEAPAGTAARLGDVRWIALLVALVALALVMWLWATR
jgi:hypothetical protein